MKFALITEGPSEHKIIKHIISRYFKQQEPEINQIQPKLVNGRQDGTTPGGWNEVLKYCERDELKDILIENDFLIIQIDTDQSQTAPFSIGHTHKNNKLKTPEELHAEVAERLAGSIKKEVNESYGSRIFFAICIHTIECWLLPVYYSNAHKAKTLNCISSLNTMLSKKDIHIITDSNKNEPHGIRAYEAVLKNWRKKQDIDEAAKYNIGFKRLLEALGKIEIPQ